jgi:hypothetical protein
VFFVSAGQNTIRILPDPGSSALIRGDEAIALISPEEALQDINACLRVWRLDASGQQ